jgi:hypothetical protein
MTCLRNKAKAKCEGRNPFGTIEKLNLFDWPQNHSNQEHVCKKVENHQTKEKQQPKRVVRPISAQVNRSKDILSPHEKLTPNNI